MFIGSSALVSAAGGAPIFVTAKPADWSGKTGNFTITNDDCVGNTAGDGAVRIEPGNTLDGNFTFEANTTGVTANILWGVYATSEDGSFDQDAVSGDIGVTNRWEIGGASGNLMQFDGSTEQTVTAWATGDRVQIKRVGSTLSYALDNTSQDGTAFVDKGDWTTTSSVQLRIHLFAGAASRGLNNVRWLP